MNITPTDSTGSPPARSPARSLAVHGPVMHAPHPVCFTGLRAAADRSLRTAPLIVERRDAEFVEGLFADLKDATRRSGLFARVPASADGAMRLFPPVQRVFNLLVMEAFCEQPGQPRLDPAKVESSGFVLRRVEGGRKLAWLKAGTQVFGWEAVDEELDPAHDRRPPAVKLGHPLLDARAPSLQRVRSAGSARLAQSPDPVSEDVQPLFVAPPEVCAAAKRTLLFGTLRVASDELTEAPAKAPVYGQDDAERAQLRDQKHLSRFLQPGGPRDLPLAGQSFGSADVLRAARAGAASTANGPMSGAAFASVAVGELILLLQQLHSEFDAFGSTPAALALQAALAPLQVETAVSATEFTPGYYVPSSAWDFLVAAKEVLLDAEPGKSLAMPHRMAEVSSAQADAIFEATLACLQQQYTQVLPGGGRFDSNRQDRAPRFVVRAFIRLKPEHPGCAGRLLWSDYSPEFTIAPWFESAGVPAPVIPMPDLLDRNQLKRIKPNVAFAMPPRLAALLRNDAKKLRDGEGDGGDGLGLAWICSFSLPIITLCAFIVLNIFLQLFNLIFFWLPFLKICIPIPKIKDPAP